MANFKMFFLQILSLPTFKLCRIAVVLTMLFAGCSTGGNGCSYQQISQEEAKKMMYIQEVIVLDVREQDEYDSGHIPGAVLLPVGTIDEETASAVIPEKDNTVLVYCISGCIATIRKAAVLSTGLFVFGSKKSNWTVLSHGSLVFQFASAPCRIPLEPV